MQSTFELVSKSIGLVVVVAGLVIGARILPEVIFVQRPYFGTIPSEQAEAMSRLFGSPGESRSRAIVALLFQGLLPVLLGMYLLRSDNYFVRLAYPNRREDQSETQHTAVTPSKPRQEATGADTPKSDAKYAPPGYET